MPLPDSHWVLSEELCGADLLGLGLTSVVLCILPETILASEGWNTTGGTDTSTSHDGDLFAVFEDLRSLCWQ